MGTHDFATVLDPDQYFQGLARQELDCHQALGELIDNSFSAQAVDQFGAKLPITIEITIEDLQNGTFCVQVADSGVGISLDDVTTRIFNPGGQGTAHGPLNEHGFGLKNALALLTGGNSTEFSLFTRSASDSDKLGADEFLGVTGPLSTDMKVRDDATRAEFAQDLHHIGTATTGTKVRVLVRERYFRSIYRVGNPGFDVLVRRLGEHLGVMHRYYIAAGNSIRLAYRRTGDEWTHHIVQAIEVPYEGSSTREEKTITVGGTNYDFVYTRGVLDYNVKDAEAEQEHGWPYPLRIYYQGSNARCGVDVVVRDRVIKSGVFSEIWPDIQKTIDFNRFAGELRVGAEFRTTNNKAGLDAHGENWEELLKLLGEDAFRPEKTTKSQSEQSLRENLVKILEGTFTGKKCQKDRAVWGGGCAIDILIEVADDNTRIYELKVTEGRVLDLYQLLMGWDGLVKENIDPSIGILVCKSASANLHAAVDAANERTDANGNKYKIEIKTIDELIPSV